MVRTPGYEPCTWYEQTAAIITKRIIRPAMNVVSPSEVLEGSQLTDERKKPKTNKFYPAFPSLDNSKLTTAPHSSIIGLALGRINSLKVFNLN